MSRLVNQGECAQGQQPMPLYFADVMTGILAALAAKGKSVLPKRGNNIDLAFERLFPDIEAEAKQSNLDVRFYVQTHPQHGDSEDVQQELYAAAKRDLVSLDNPEYQTVRFKISRVDAPAYLHGLPGSPAMYERLADRFLQYYHQA